MRHTRRRQGAIRRGSHASGRLGSTSRDLPRDRRAPVCAVPEYDGRHPRNVQGVGGTLRSDPPKRRSDSWRSVPFERNSATARSSSPRKAVASARRPSTSGDATPANGTSRRVVSPADDGTSMTQSTTTASVIPPASDPIQPSRSCSRTNVDGGGAGAVIPPANRSVPSSQRAAKPSCTTHTRRPPRSRHRRNARAGGNDDGSCSGVVAASGEQVRRRTVRRDDRVQREIPSPHPILVRDRRWVDHVRMDRAPRADRRAPSRRPRQTRRSRLTA